MTRKYYDRFPAITDKSQRVYAGMVSAMDDGIDLMAQLAGRGPSLRPPLFWRTQPIQAMREGDWKYLKDLDGEEFLYRVSVDPKETSNLAAQETARLARMRGRYDQWSAEMAAPKWQARSISYEFDGRSFKFTP